MSKQSRALSLPDPLRDPQTIAYVPEVDSLLRGANLVALQVGGAFLDTQHFHWCSL